MALRIRMLPMAIGVGVVALTLKIGAILQESHIALVPEASAEQEMTPPAAEPAEKHDPDAAHADTTEMAAGEAAHADAGDAAKGDAAKGAGLVFDAAKATDVELELLQSLADRRRALDRREEALSLKVAALAATEKRLSAKIEALAKMKAEIEALLKRYDDEEEAKLRSLVKIYENMKPKSAARIFEKLDMKVLLDVVERMREAKTAPILAKMAPDRANEVTAELAARRRLPELDPQ